MRASFIPGEGDALGLLVWHAGRHHVFYAADGRSFELLEDFDTETGGVRSPAMSSNRLLYLTEFGSQVASVELPHLN